MTATLLDLTSRLARARAAASCDACARDTKVGLCYPHRLALLADEVREELEDHVGELLMPAADLERVLTSVLEVLDGITRECLTTPKGAPDGRTCV